MKKICLALTFFLALAAVIPAHAEGTQTVMTSGISLPPLEEAPMIDVTVPQSGRIIINPYGLPTEIDGSTSTEQIVSETMPITNESTAPIVVSASIAGRVSEPSSLRYALQSPANLGEKEVFLYAEFQNEGGIWLGSYVDANNQILISEQDSGPQEVLALDAYAMGMFRLFGAASLDPDDPWCSDDTISVTLTFTFSALDEPSMTQTAEDTTGESSKYLYEEPTVEPISDPEEESSDDLGAGQGPLAGETPGGELPEASPEESGNETADEPADAAV